MAKKKKVLC